MSNKKKNRVFILSTKKWSDNSLIITSVSENQGILKLIAKGALKPKSPFRGCFEVFNFADIIYSEKSSRQLQILTDIDVKASYQNIRKEGTGVALLFLMAEIIINLINEHEELSLLFRHLIRLLDWMDENPTFLTSGLINFITAILKFSGYGLDYGHCVKCGSSKDGNQIFIDLEHGTYLHLNCNKEKQPQLYLLPSKILVFLRTMNPFANLIQNKAEISKSEISAFLFFINSYLSFHLGKRVVLKSTDLFLNLF